jgi:hypothetical protein
MFDLLKNIGRVVHSGRGCGSVDFARAAHAKFFHEMLPALRVNSVKTADSLSDRPGKSAAQS